MNWNKVRLEKLQQKGKLPDYAKKDPKFWEWPKKKTDRARQASAVARRAKPITLAKISLLEKKE